MFIYKIHNYITDECYIGSTGNLDSRRNKHFSELYKHTHPNPFLQKAFDNYSGNLKFEMLYEFKKPVSEQVLLDKEQEFIEMYSPYMLYNIHMTPAEPRSVHKIPKNKTLRILIKRRRKFDTCYLKKLCIKHGIPIQTILSTVKELVNHGHLIYRQKLFIKVDK